MIKLEQTLPIKELVIGLDDATWQRNSGVLHCLNELLDRLIRYVFTSEVTESVANSEQ